jgi:hypothetical protein
MMFGDHTQTMFLAPIRVKISCTCRHALTYSPTLLPLVKTPHGYQKPFISCAKRIAIV